MRCYDILHRRARSQAPGPCCVKLDGAGKEVLIWSCWEGHGGLWGVGEGWCAMR